MAMYRGVRALVNVRLRQQDPGEPRCCNGLPAEGDARGQTPGLLDVGRLVYVRLEQECELLYPPQRDERASPQLKAYSHWTCRASTN